jgi:hypothetical protein
MGQASLRCASALLAAVAACTPDTQMVGTLATSSGSTGPAGTSSGAADGASSGAAEVTGIADADGGPSSSDTTDAEDSSTSSDSPPADVPPASCDVAIKGNAMVSGASPLGDIDMMFGWYATRGGGKCDISYVAWFLPSAAAGDTQLDDAIETVPDVVRLQFEIPKSGLPGEGLVHVEHWMNGETEAIAATATLEMGGGPLDTDTLLVGSFVADGPQWALSGEFSLPWCELIMLGACGA